MFQYYSPSFTNTKNRKRQTYLRAGCPCRPPWYRTPAASSTQSCGYSPSAPHQWPPPCSPPDCCPRTWCCPQCSGRRGRAPGSRVRCIRNFFFIRFEANVSKYGSFSLHIRSLRYIRKHYLFASFASYSLQNIRTNSNKNIQFVAKQIHFLILANICFKKFV